MSNLKSSSKRAFQFRATFEHKEKALVKDNIKRRSEFIKKRNLKNKLDDLSTSSAIKKRSK